jgi:lathosterol oxidase
VAVDSMIPLSALTVPWFVGEVRGYSKLYSDLHLKTWQGVAYEIWTMAWFLLFTDCIIYWVHRWLHHPLLYTRIHKPHHRWIVPTPYASHAFHPLDGYAQSIAYHMFVYLFPMHRVLYLVMFVFVNVWTVSIHGKIVL